MSPQSLSFETERENTVHQIFPWQQILLANLAFAGVALLLYGTYCMFSSFFIPLLWGTIVALLLREVRSSLDSHLKAIGDRWNLLHAWSSPPDAVFALQLIVGAVNFVAGVVPEWIARFIAFAFTQAPFLVVPQNDSSLSRAVEANTPERPSVDHGSSRSRTQQRRAMQGMSTHRNRPPRSPPKFEYRGDASYRNHMIVLVRISCSWLLATRAGLAFGLLAVTAIVVLQFVLKKIVLPFIGSHSDMVQYISLIFNRICLFATFVGAAALLGSGGSMGAPLMLSVITVLFKTRVQFIQNLVPLKSVALVLIFFIATVVFVIASYFIAWNVYHELRLTYNGATDGVTSYLQFLPSDAVDVLSQQFLQWSNFSSLSNAALDFFKSDVIRGNMSHTWADAARHENISTSSNMTDPVALAQTYLGPFASWVPEYVLVWSRPLLQQLLAGVDAGSLYSQLSKAYSQLTSYGYVTSVLSYAKAIFIDFSGYSFAFFLSILLQSVSQM